MVLPCVPLDAGSLYEKGQKVEHVDGRCSMRRLICLSLLVGLAGCGASGGTSAQPVAATVVSVEAEPAAQGASQIADGTEEVQSVWRPGDPVPEAWLRPELATGRAPDSFVVVMDTTKGPVVLRIERSWAPEGVDRFHHLVSIGYYTDIAIFRAIAGFMVQFGIHGVPEVNRAWKEAKLQDDPVVSSNERGRISFAMAGPNSRTVQLFISTIDNSRLDAMGFTPIGEVVSGMDVVDSFHTGYGEGQPMGHGPSQNELQTRGNEYVREGFPDLDYIRTMRFR